MATKTRSKADVRTGKGKSGRRPPAKVKSGPDIPLLPIVVAGILLALAVGIIIYVVANNKPTAGPQAVVAGIPCDQLEHTQVHYHTALQIIYQGNIHPISQDIGMVGDPSAPTCFYWLHVHAANTNVIHIEAPASQTFTLGQFFAIWAAWAHEPEPLDATHVSSITLTPDEKLVIYIDLQDGKGPQPYTGDPKAIPLKAREVITLEITPPAVTPPPSFTFTSGL